MSEHRWGSAKCGCEVMERQSRVIAGGSADGQTSHELG
jgi:hypothetical protein